MSASPQVLQEPESSRVSEAFPVSEWAEFLASEWAEFLVQFLGLVASQVVWVGARRGWDVPEKPQGKDLTHWPCLSRGWDSCCCGCCEGSREGSQVW